MESFFRSIYEFLIDAGRFDVTNSLYNNVATDVSLLTLILALLLLSPLSEELHPMTSIGRLGAFHTRALP